MAKKIGQQEWKRALCQDKRRDLAPDSNQTLFKEGFLESEHVLAGWKLHANHFSEVRITPIQVQSFQWSVDIEV